MNKVRRIIIYSEEKKLSEREIARSLKIARDTVSEYLDKYKKSGITFENIKGMNDKELLLKLGCQSESRNEAKYETLVEEFPLISKEIKKVGVTLQILWEEYIKKNPEGYQYTQFCRHYSDWRKDSGELATMHINHKVGDKMFVDYAGKHLYITSKETGEKTPAEIFVGVLGGSLLTYVTATESQKKADWIKGNEGALRYIRGVPNAIVPDCLKSGVTDANRYDPEINAEYQDFADHYNTVILPARPASPKDKSLVENAVRIVYMWIYAALRDRIFYSLEELNIAIAEKLEDYNNRPMKKLKMSRWEFFNEVEKNSLQPLPNDYYSIRKFLTQTVPFIYHIEIPEDYHYYSVPHKYINRKVKIIYTSTAVEIYYQNERIAFHKRVFSRKDYTTLPEHMPPHHRWYS
jgi:transposase